ncbi:hypothetical protein PR048_027559 [Dryococelus australis]|uniref:Uncharacterized protein n=1 Tax=Dryococelus australis TaxID=614101 RepID=A0ABQ9GGW5_9NEOP|nr:hypothetical protein PR048_027559 [Dryococelus australis]
MHRSRRRFSVGLLLRYEATPFLTELRVIGAQDCEVSEKVWPNDERSSCNQWAAYCVIFDASILLTIRRRRLQRPHWRKSRGGLGPHWSYNDPVDPRVVGVNQQPASLRQSAQRSWLNLQPAGKQIRLLEDSRRRLFIPAAVKQLHPPPPPPGQFTVDPSRISRLAVLRRRAGSGSGFFFKCGAGPQGKRSIASTCDTNPLGGGGAVAERLARPPATKANRAQIPSRVTGFSPVGIVPDDGTGWRAFSGISHIYPAISFRRCSVLTSITHVGSQDLAVKRRPNLFTHESFVRHKECRANPARRLNTLAPVFLPAVQNSSNVAGGAAKVKLDRVGDERLPALTRAATCFNTRSATMCLCLSYKIKDHRHVHGEITMGSDGRSGGSISLRRLIKVLSQMFTRHFHFNVKKVNCFLSGATVTEWLACSPPTKANRVQSPAGSLPDFRRWESCRTMPLVGGELPFPPALSFRRRSLFTSITLIGSQDHDVDSRPNLFTHCFIFVIANFLWRTPDIVPGRRTDPLVHTGRCREEGINSQLEGLISELTQPPRPFLHRPSPQTTRILPPNELFWAFKIEKRGNDKGDTNTHHQCLITPTLKACIPVPRVNDKRPVFAVCSEHTALAEPTFPFLHPLPASPAKLPDTRLDATSRFNATFPAQLRGANLLSIFSRSKQLCLRFDRCGELKSAARGGEIHRVSSILCPRCRSKNNTFTALRCGAKEHRPEASVTRGTWKPSNTRWTFNDVRSHRPLCRRMFIARAAGGLNPVAAKWLRRSPPTTAMRVRYPVGSLPDFCIWEWCWTMPLAGGFSRGTPFSPRPCILGSHVMSGDDGHLRVPAGKPVTRRVLPRPGFAPHSTVPISHIVLFSALEANKQEGDKGYSATGIWCAVATKRKARNWRAMFSSCCVYLWDLNQSRTHPNRRYSRSQLQSTTHTPLATTDCSRNQPPEPTRNVTARTARSHTCSTVAERRRGSRKPAHVPPRRTMFNPRLGHSRIFACENRAGRCRYWAPGFLGDLPFTPAPSFRRCSILTSITLIGSQDLAFKSHPNLFHSLVLEEIARALKLIFRKFHSAAQRRRRETQMSCDVMSTLVLLGITATLVGREQKPIVDVRLVE